MAKESMKAAVFEGDGKLAVKEVPKPILEDTAFTKRDGGELIFGKEDLVLLKVLRAGICGTELHILSVPPKYPASPGTILGHEFVGEVLEVGERVKRVKVGDKVVVDEHIWCGDCWYCRKGYLNRCEEVASLGMSDHGGFAQYAVVPAKQLYKIPPQLDLDKAVLFEPLYCAVHALNKVEIRPEETVLIFGAGTLGCCFVELCRIAGVKQIIASEPSDYRRKFAKQLGALAVNPKAKNLEKLVNELTEIGVDVAIDACGIPAVIKEAVELTRARGRISLFGEQDDSAEITLCLTKANRKELEFYGSDAASPFVADRTIEIIKRDDFKLDKIVTHQLPLNEILKGIELMKQRKTIKAVVDPWEEGDKK